MMLMGKLLWCRGIVLWLWGNDGVMWLDWVWIGKGLIYMAKWAFLKLLGKLRGLWEMNEIR